MATRRRREKACAHCGASARENAISFAPRHAAVVCEDRYGCITRVNRMERDRERRQGRRGIVAEKRGLARLRPYSRY